MNDQYGEKIPIDLVLMPTNELLTDVDIKLIDSVAWYDVITEGNIWLCVSAEAIKYMGADDLNCYDDGLILEVMRVNDVLKRWTIEEGFYHA